VDVPGTVRGLAPAADRLTDVAYRDLGVWVAGHRKLRPVVDDVDPITRQQGRRELPVPGTRLDPRHPVVLVAGTPVAAPPGVLEAAVTVAGGICLVPDGVLWYRPLEVPELRQG
jgi:hypothetical protein